MSSVNFLKILRHGNTLEVARYGRPLIRDHLEGRVFTRRKKDETTLKLGFNLQRAKRTIRRAVATTSYYQGRPAFATLTYKKQEYDIQKALSDWRAFTQRMKKFFPDAAYIRVPERHKKDGIHFHMVIFGLPATLPCITKKVSAYKRPIHDCPESRPCERKLRLLAKAWGLGYVDLNVVRRPERIGSYLAKYLTKDAPDWRMFGHHVVSSNLAMHKQLQYARSDGTLWDMSSYKDGDGLWNELETVLAKATTISDRPEAFMTKWLGMCRYSVYEVPKGTIFDDRLAWAERYIKEHGS